MTQGFDPVSDDSSSPLESVSNAIPTARPVASLQVTPSDLVGRAFRLEEASRKSAWADLGTLIVTLVAFELYAGLALVSLAGVTDPGADATPVELQQTMLLPGIALRSTAVFALVVLILRHRRQGLCSVGLTGHRWGRNLLIGAGSVGLAVVLIFMWQLSMWLLRPGLFDEMVENTELLIELIPRLHPLAYVPLAFLVGLYEELLFRGFLMTRLRRATGSWVPAVIVSMAVFVALHAADQKWVALGPIAILALVFSLVTIWRRSIVPAVVGHTLFDLGAFLYLWWYTGAQ